MSLSKTIKKIRQDRKMTLKEMAQHLGIPASTYRDWEYGSKIPADAIYRIAQLFETSPNELFGLKKVQNQNRLQAVQLIEEGLRLLKIE